MKNLFFLIILFYSFSMDVLSQNVGIGISAPTEKLHIDSGNIKLGNFVWTISSNYSLKFGDGNFVTIGEDEADDRLLIKARNIIFKPSSGTYTGYVGINTPSGSQSPLEIYSTSSAASNLPGLRLTAAPGFSVPSTSWNIYSYTGGPIVYGFYFAREGIDKAYIDGNDGSFHAISDRNFKKDITYLAGTSVLPQIEQLKPAAYFMKTDTFNLQHKLGFISQDVETIFPELVSDRKGIKMMNYSGLIPILTKGIQEQQQQILALQKENTDLKKRLEKLEKIILNGQQ